MIEIIRVQPQDSARLKEIAIASKLCDAVTGRENSAAQLEAIERMGLFLETLDGPGAWYRYHALFAEAIRQEASRRLVDAIVRMGSAMRTPRRNHERTART